MVSYRMLIAGTAVFLLSAPFSPCAAQAPQPEYTPVSTTQLGDRGQIQKWFNDYDDIRRNAQMTPEERRQADELLSKGMAILAPGPEKDAARALLTKLVDRYTLDKAAMKALPLLPATQKLHRGYYQYFSTAHDLFSSYLTLQDNLFAKDEQGQPILGQLMERKQKLESLNTFIQNLDQETRTQLNIAAYKGR